MAAREVIYQFYDFELSTARRELRKHGLRVRISKAQMGLLIQFLEHPGDLIPRARIASCLWADTSNLDVPSGLNTAINRLRYTLGDDATNPIYLETVSGVGYRFVAPVRAFDSTGKPVVNSGSPLGDRLRQRFANRLSNSVRSYISAIWSAFRKPSSRG
ncbi:winged helix-turn-helix domain-containing protein [Bryocella elongata]|nr:winged helix-turn-helix domain-containing protein [Bryocella elongata]